MDKKEFNTWLGIDMVLDSCVEKLRGEFHLSNSKICYKLVERAIEIKPEKQKFIKISSKTVNQAIKKFIEKEKAGEQRG